LSGSLIAVGDAVLLSHPNSERRPTPFGRRNLTLSVSRGPAAGQLAFEPLLQVHAGPAAYSSLAPLAPGRVGLVYESSPPQAPSIDFQVSGSRLINTAHAPERKPVGFKCITLRYAWYLWAGSMPALSQAITFAAIALLGGLAVDSDVSAHPPTRAVQKSDDASGGGGGATTPRVVLNILADDIGYHDVNWRNNQTITPALDGLVAQGLEIPEFYVYKFCAASRSSILTGRYPYHLGLCES
jgi:hypothetical protein